MQSVDEYVESAYSHLDAADILLTRGLYKLAVFHLHQALEFLLKALLIKRGYKPTKTHALHLLARGYQLTPEELNFLRELTIHYYASRYPDARQRYGISEEYYNKQRVETMYYRTREIFLKLREHDCTPDIGKLENGREAYREVLKWLQELEKKGIKIKLAAIIGSRAKGIWRPWSDIDVILIAENLPPPSIQRYLLLLSDEIDLDIRAYTPEEAEKAIENLEREFLDLEQHGKIVRDDGIYSKIKRKINQVKQRYEIKYIEELDTWLIKPRQSKRT